MAKIYFVDSELFDEVSFESEVERNEMALALAEEHAEFFAMRCLNWYGEAVSAEEAWEAATNSVYTWEKIQSFEKPTALAYWNAEEERYFGGIGYKEEVICGCYGDALNIEDIYASAPCDVNPIIDYPEHWPMISGWIIQLPEVNFNRDYQGFVGELVDEW